MRVLQRFGNINNKSTRHILHRSRLFEVLDQTEFTPLTWISAPAGSGKTTLIDSYLQSRELVGLWYQCSDEDNDLASFFFHLASTYQAMHPLRKAVLPLLQPEYQLGIKRFGKNFFRVLFEKAVVPGVIVFDDFQFVQAESPLHIILRESLSYLPDGLRILITSRSQPPSIYARLRVDGSLIEIAAEDMLFTPQESKDLAKLMLPDKQLNTKMLLEWHGKTRGWVTGLVLHLVQLRQGNVTDTDKADEHIFDFFAGEYFDGLEQNTKRFLAISSLFKVFTVTEVRRLTTNKKAREILRDLVNQQFFIIQQGRYHTVYEYHPLLRDFLSCQFNEMFSEQEKIVLRNNAGEILSRKKNWSDAAALFYQTKNNQALAQLLTQHADAALKQGRHELLQKWMAVLPEGISHQEPWLKYWRGMAIVQYDPIKARPFFESATELFRENNNAKGAFLSWAGIANCYVLALDTFQGARQWIDVLNEMEERWPRTFNKVNNRIPITFSALNLLAHISVDYAEIHKWAKRAEMIYRYTPIQGLRVALSVGLSVHSNISAEVGRIRKLSCYNYKILSNDKAPPMERIIAATSITISAWMTSLPNNIDGLEVLAEGLKVAEQSGIHILDSILLLQGIHLLLQCNDIENAQLTLQQLWEVKETHNQISRAFYFVMSSHIEAEFGNHSTALAYLQDAIKIIDEHAYETMPELPFRAVLALQLNEMGRYDEAIPHMKRSFELSKRLHSPLGQFMIGCFKARSAYLQNNDEETIALLRSSLADAREREIICFGHWRPTMMVELLQFALEQNIEVDYVCKIIRLTNLIPSTPPLHLLKWPWPIKIFTLGHFAIYIQDELLVFRGKPPKKPLELLKTLIALGAVDVPIARIMDKLWPESEGDAAKSAFDSTLQRLRRLLKDDKLLILQNAHLSLDPLRCWVDVSALDFMIYAEIQSENTGKRIKHILRLYRGVFLNEMSSPCVLLRRQQLHSKVVRSLDALCDALLLHQDNESVEEILENIIEIAPYSEVFYQRLMQVHLDQGRMADVILAYERCKQTLKNGLGISPAEKSECLYQNALKKQS